MSKNVKPALDLDALLALPKPSDTDRETGKVTAELLALEAQESSTHVPIQGPVRCTDWLVSLMGSHNPAEMWILGDGSDQLSVLNLDFMRKDRTLSIPGMKPSWLFLHRMEIADLIRQAIERVREDKDPWGGLPEPRLALHPMFARHRTSASSMARFKDTLVMVFKPTNTSLERIDSTYGFLSKWLSVRKQTPTSLGLFPIIRLSELLVAWERYIVSCVLQLAAGATLYATPISVLQAWTSIVSKLPADQIPFPSEEGILRESRAAKLQTAFNILSNPTSTPAQKDEVRELLFYTMYTHRGLPRLLPLLLCRGTRSRRRWWGRSIAHLIPLRQYL